MLPLPRIQDTQNMQNPDNQDESVTGINTVDTFIFTSRLIWAIIVLLPVSMRKEKVN